MNAQPRDEENDELPLEQASLPHLVSDAEDAPTSTKGFSVVNQEVPIALEHALIRTLAMFQQHNLATSEDCNHVAETVKRKWLEGKGCDPVDCLARLSAGTGDMLDASVEALSVKLASTLPEAPTRIPFAGKLIAPTSFYEKNPYILSICKLMRVPVAYAEDLDVLALASINPYFMDALSVSIADYAMQHIGTQPIISSIRLDYAGWVNMCNKHFKEEVDHD